MNQLHAIDARLTEQDLRLKSSSADLEQAFVRLQDAHGSVSSARGAALRRILQGCLASTSEAVRAEVAARFTPPPGAAKAEGAARGSPDRLPAYSVHALEARVAQEYEASQSGQSLASCLRTASERLYLAWGYAVFTVLCWWHGIEEGR
jgi:hypothetical protein